MWLWTRVAVRRFGVHAEQRKLTNVDFVRICAVTSSFSFSGDWPGKNDPDQNARRSSNAQFGTCRGFR